MSAMMALTRYSQFEARKSANRNTEPEKQMQDQASSDTDQIQRPASATINISKSARHKIFSIFRKISSFYQALARGKRDNIEYFGKVHGYEMGHIVVA